ncbi:hypothetical protein GALMADRAFT_258056 [Galerina marginata CBS 339.88]|uniref:Uncharacterized protein n=1 Tax=Galerina marginata (strain CBS 339.88) TaxID=685588 RepID=A0A067SIG3_GALM3|nr:hypothetical protein GALMADRAFT_258056 [Galerina marginata CBS 339.88]
MLQPLEQETSASASFERTFPVAVIALVIRYISAFKYAASLAVRRSFNSASGSSARMLSLHRIIPFDANATALAMPSVFRNASFVISARTSNVQHTPPALMNYRPDAFHAMVSCMYVCCPRYQALDGQTKFMSTLFVDNPSDFRLLVQIVMVAELSLGFNVSGVTE